MKVDLHIHTNASDGSIEIEELFDEIIQKDLGLFSITDHEVISDIEKIKTFSAQTSIDYIIGCEITVNAGGKRHILGYNINPEDKDLKELLETNQKTVLTGIDSDPFNFPEVKYAIEVIKGAGGVPILAHPGCAFYGPNYKEYIKDMLENGIEGIECYHPDNNTKVTEYCLDICETFNLYVTGGSDYHGEINPDRQLDMMKIKLEQLNLKNVYW